MPMRTIALELDAYVRLWSCRRPGESFSDVVRRAIFVGSPPTGAELLIYFRNGGSGVSEVYLDYLEQAARGA